MAPNREPCKHTTAAAGVNEQCAVCRDRLLQSYRNPRLNELAALKRDWDSYKAEAITPSALAAADNVTFVPCGDGGMQVEIHVGSGQQVEVFIEPSGRISGVYLKGVEVEDSDPL